MCEPCKRHSFNPVRVDAFGVCATDCCVGKQCGQPCHERAIVRAAAAYQQLFSERLSGFSRLYDGQGGELEQGCLNVLGGERGQTLQVML